MSKPQSGPDYVRENINVTFRDIRDVIPQPHGTPKLGPIREVEVRARFLVEEFIRIDEAEMATSDIRRQMERRAENLCVERIMRTIYEDKRRDLMELVDEFRVEASDPFSLKFFDALKKLSDALERFCPPVTPPEA